MLAADIVFIHFVQYCFAGARSRNSKATHRIQQRHKQNPKPKQSSQKMRLNQVFNGIGRYSPVWAGNLARRRCLQVTRPSHRLPPASLTRALPRCTSGFLTYNFHGIHLFCTARSLVLAALTVHALSAEIAEHLFLMLAGVEIAGLEMRALSDDRARAQVRFPLRIWFIPAHL